VPVPFFQRSSKPRAERADIRGLDDLSSIPTTVKAELRRSEEKHPPSATIRRAGVAGHSPRRVDRTSGRPALILWTRKDLEVDHQASARGRWRWGCAPG
jgi:phenylacetate-coenzyme A ligase PaaK-like adenylate-forming protein